MAKKVRLGIVGTSAWAEMIYLKTLQSDPDAEIVAICGRNREHTDAVASRYGIREVHTDYNKLFAHSDLDGVIIATPDDQHLPMALAAIETGLHVLCEKPLANTASDARRMLDAAEAAQLRHMVMFTWRWQPHFQYLKSLIAEGVFGRVFRAQFSFIANFAQDDAYQWRLDPKRANGVIANLGSHMIDLGHWMLGPVTSVSADLGTAHSRATIPGHEGGSGYDIAHVTLRFANGAQGVVDVTEVSHSADRFMRHVVRIEAEKASLEIDHVFLGALAGVTLRWFGAGEQQSRLLDIPDQFYGTSDRQNVLGVYATEPVGARGFVAAIRDGTRPSPDFEDGWRAQHVIDAAIASHADRRWVDIDG
jgi:predicted dehydrogenase